MKEFIFLFRHRDAGRAPEEQSAEDRQKHGVKWKSWMDNLDKQGWFVTGRQLEASGSVVRGAKKQVTDGPFMEGKEIVGGFVMIKAKDLQEAVELSKGCPIFENDGIVEVRPIQEMNM